MPYLAKIAPTAIEGQSTRTARKTLPRRGDADLRKVDLKVHALHQAASLRPPDPHGGDAILLQAALAKRHFK